jgi:hypothetical protein
MASATPLQSLTSSSRSQTAMQQERQERESAKCSGAGLKGVPTSEVMLDLDDLDAGHSRIFTANVTEVDVDVRIGGDGE